MRFEIERKFLVSDDGWRAGITRSSRLRDGLLLLESGAKLRVRLEENAAWITLKGPRQGISRLEFEYPVPRPHAEAMLAQLCGGRVIDKIRHFVPVAGQIWQVDEHLGPLAGLVTAEIELTREDEPITRPAWLGREVTGDPRFAKTALLGGTADRAGP